MRQLNSPLLVTALPGAKPFASLTLIWILMQAGWSHADELIESTPLAARSSESVPETLFRLIPPEESGISLVSPIDPDHPLARAYHSSSACAAVAIGDLDLDGRPDVFAGNGPGDNALYLQTGPMEFTDVTQETGVSGGDDAWAVGISLADVDNDGDLDIYVCNYDYPNQLFENLLIDDGERTGGPIRFAERAAQYGLALREGSVVPAFADYDRDGDLDVYILTHQIYRENGRPSDPIRIFEEGGKLFVSEEWQRWYIVDQWRRGDNGEFLYTEAGRPDYLFRNDGPDGFTDVTAAAGISTERHWGNSSTWWDFNYDGWPDLYVGNDFRSPDYLYRNNGDGTFTEVSQDHVRHTTWFSMGAVQSDFNNDGYIDFLLADMMPRTHYMQKASMASMADRLDNLEHVDGAFQIMHNTLHINTGGDLFMEGAWMAGLAQTEWTWAIRSADFDNDGLADVLFCNGIPRQFNHSDLPEITHETLVGRTHWDFYRDTPERREQNLAFRNLGDFQFEDVSAAWGLDHVGMSYGASLGDLDGDGNLELLTSNLEDPLSVYRNRESGNNRVVIDLRGTRSNNRGIGTLVTLETPDGVTQSRHLFPYGGFLDADEPIVHFGLGQNEEIALLRLQWPSGEDQVFRDLEVNRRYTVTEPDSGAEKAPPVRSRQPSETWFRESPSLRGFPHEETGFDDFDRQPLLPLKLSQLGPGQAWGDIDGDGDPDFFLGGAMGQSGRLFRNQTTPGSGEVILAPEGAPALAADAASEDMGGLFFDADGDGDQDLYVVSGGVETEPDGAVLQDRLYLNSGRGEFEKAPDGTLPRHLESGGVVAAADFDRDGDLDLFVGSRSIPGRYPESPASILMRNEGGAFKAVTAELAPDLVRAGLVTSALWSDVDSDGWIDLMVTTDWGPVRLFRNRQGRFVDDTEGAGLSGAGLATLGMWNGIAGGDIDNDGDIDFVATNVGRNTQYDAALDSPEIIFYGDFDNSGKKHIVEARFLVEKGEKICYPRRGFMAAGAAMPYILDKMQTFHNYASQSITGIYDVDKIQQSSQFRVNNLDSSVLVNDGTGRFELRSLPHLAQISPAYGVALRDIDLDGHLDCYLVHNLFSIPEELGRLASGLSLLLRGTGNGDEPFEPVWPRESGLEVTGDAKSLGAVDVNMDGREDFVVGVNDAEPRIFVNSTAGLRDTHPLRLRVSGTAGNPASIGARVSIEAGDLPRQTREIRAGGGYLSQSSSDLIFAVPSNQDDPITVTIVWPDGKRSETQVESKARFLNLSRNQ